LKASFETKAGLTVFAKVDVGPFLEVLKTDPPARTVPAFMIDPTVCMLLDNSETFLP
jgi:hypothetical protein